MSRVALVLSSAMLGLTSATTNNYDRPQYLAVNFDFDVGSPSSFSQEAISEMLSALNNELGGPTRRLAFSFDLWTLYDANVT